MEGFQKQTSSKNFNMVNFSNKLFRYESNEKEMNGATEYQTKKQSQLITYDYLNLLLNQEIQETKTIIIGSEVELLVLDNFFRESNKAEQVLNLTKKQKNSFFVQECSQCNVEFVGSPNNLKGIITELTQNLNNLDNITKSQNMILVPIDFPLNIDFKPNITNHSRYFNKEKIIGKTKFDICKRILGTHFHFDLDSRVDVKINQINFLSLFDPLAIIATATNRQFLNGIMINNWRVYAYRYLAHGEFPFQGDIQRLYNNYEEYSQTLTDEYNKFLGISLLRGVDFSKNSTRENAVWGPVRINLKHNTVEMRSMSSHPNMITVMSVVALASGGLRQIIKGEVNMQEFYESLTGTSNLQKASDYLKKIDYEAALYGFKSDKVVDYCNNLLLFCIRGLEGEETKLVKKGLQNFWKKTSDIETIILSEKSYEQKYAELYDIYVNSLKELKSMGLNNYEK